MVLAKGNLKFKQQFLFTVPTKLLPFSAEMHHHKYYWKGGGTQVAEIELHRY